MKLETQFYSEQQACLPEGGKQILAQYDEKSIIVYQAYKTSIAAYASSHQAFGGSEYSFNRMSWIKPNFLWMMYRSGWAAKPGQEAILAIRIRRAHFEQILAGAVHSSFKPDVYQTQANWQHAMDSSDIRLQWDPDHNPFGAKLERRAIQLGLKGETLKRFAIDWILEIEDITPFVADQRRWLDSREVHKLVVPKERIYPVEDEKLQNKLRLTKETIL